MNYSKAALDRYITAEPPGAEFDSWAEQVLEGFTDKFWEDQELWCMKAGGLADRWMDKLYAKGKAPADAARIIERAFFYYKVNKHETD